MSTPEKTFVENLEISMKMSQERAGEVEVVRNEDGTVNHTVVYGGPIPEVFYPTVVISPEDLKDKEHGNT